MTYCVALALAEGAVLLADTRTNAGVDNIATFSKLHLFQREGERVIALMSAGNLAITQSVVTLLREGVDFGETGDGRTLDTVSTMFRAARLVGEAVRAVHTLHADGMQAQNIAFDASFLLCGQIRGEPMRLFQIYAAGNFIEANPDTPFLQIGEHKYGKPILDRAARHETPLRDAVKLALISMDSTLRSNLSVGLPIDLLVLRRDALAIDLQRRIGEDDPYFRALRDGWSGALRQAYMDMASPPWFPGPLL